MAISYSLELATSETVEQVAAHVHEVIDSAGLLESDVPETALTTAGADLASGQWIGVLPAQPPPWGDDPAVTDLGLAAPTVHVTFRQSGAPEADDRSSQQDEMVSIVVALLERVPGDAVLHFQFEIVWLVRRDGQLVVSDYDDVWTPQRLAMLPEPVERASMAFADA